MDWQIIWDSLPELLGGLQLTVEITALSVAIGLVLAVPLAILRLHPNPLIWTPVYGFIFFFRGTPLLVQLFFFYDGVGRLLPEIPGVRETWMWPILRDAFFYGALAFTISVGAYAGEVMRGAMKSVPAGELEAARAFGIMMTGRNSGVLIGPILLAQTFELAGSWDWAAPVMGTATAVALVVAVWLASKVRGADA